MKFICRYVCMKNARAVLNNSTDMKTEKFWAGVYIFNIFYAVDFVIVCHRCFIPAAEYLVKY
jgi:alkyl hydroperoxide reductase subunit AhpC